MIFTSPLRSFVKSVEFSRISQGDAKFMLKLLTIHNFKILMKLFSENVSHKKKIKCVNNQK